MRTPVSRHHSSRAQAERRSRPRIGGRLFGCVLDVWRRLGARQDPRRRPVGYVSARRWYAWREVSLDDWAVRP